MGGVDLGEEDHLLHELALSETLVDEQVVLLVNSTVAALAGSAENLEPSAEPVRRKVRTTVRIKNASHEVERVTRIKL